MLNHNLKLIILITKIIIMLIQIHLQIIERANKLIAFKKNQP